MSHPAPSFAVRIVAVFAGMALLAGCSRDAGPQEPPRAEPLRPARREEALALQSMKQVVEKFYVPSGSASGAVRTELLARAEEGFTKLLARFPDQTNVAARAWRNLGNVLAEQGRVREAVSAYGTVATNYPTAEWEILQTWKAAGDLLWTLDRTNDAVPFYRALVDRYESRTNQAEVIGLVVKGARNRLQEAGAPER